jgi:hypothetical protein
LTERQIRLGSLGELVKLFQGSCQHFAGALKCFVPGGGHKPRHPLRHAIVIQFVCWYCVVLYPEIVNGGLIGCEREIMPETLNCIPNFWLGGFVKLHNFSGGDGSNLLPDEHPESVLLAANARAVLAPALEKMREVSSDKRKKDFKGFPNDLYPGCAMLTFLAGYWTYDWKIRHSHKRALC